ncbi:MAG: cation-transporting P-type ATPase, partial [Burkholderiales bacterium]|nr:cation-transporting P-type ATPase [Burkholderiales bacterium]
ALVRKPPAVETLGSVTWICSDKTGTLTQNRMRVEALAVNGERLAPARVRLEDPLAAELLRAMALNNDTRVGAAAQAAGDPTEVALYEAAREAGLDAAELGRRLPRVAELPFDPERRRMSTLHRETPSSEALLAYVKGSPESVLPLCTQGAAGTRSFEPERIAALAQAMAAEGLRLLAFARRRFESPPPLDPARVETGLEFLGLAALLDPPRAEVAAAIAEAKGAGIVPVMITGDHPDTARAIALRIGLTGGDREEEVLTGAELSRLTDEEFARRVRAIRVYARAAPEHKIRIVQALQRQGECVAMTGDGVNDAPALKRADIGVAMGVSGTDVAKEAAHMMLLDDNFATIVAAVRAGRRIFDNVRKFIRYAMTGNSGEIWTIFLAPFLGMPIPLLPIHILWINLVTDGLPGLAFSSEGAERDIMRRAPRPPNESIFAHGMWQHIVWVGLLMGAACLFTQAWSIGTGTGHWQTMVFTVLTLSQLGHALAIRSERESLFTQGPWSNRPLALAVVLTFALQMATIYVPWLNPIFRTEPLSAGELLFCLAMSTVVFAGVEIEKWLVRRGWLYREAGVAASQPS